MKRLLLLAVAASDAGRMRGHPRRPEPLQQQEPVRQARSTRSTSTRPCRSTRRSSRPSTRCARNPRSAALHNRARAAPAAQKGFPKDAETEFERAVNADTHFYPGWYNLGLVRAARGNYTGARFAFNRAVQYKPRPLRGALPARV